IFTNHTSNTILSIYIIDGGISEENKTKILSLNNQKHCIQLIQIELGKYKNLPETDHLSRATWYRLLIPEALPNLDKILYLDIDILVLKDLYCLYNHNINNYI